MIECMKGIILGRHDRRVNQERWLGFWGFRVGVLKRGGIFRVLREGRGRESVYAGVAGERRSKESVCKRNGREISGFWPLVSRPWKSGPTRMGQLASCIWTVDIGIGPTWNGKNVIHP